MDRTKVPRSFWIRLLIREAGAISALAGNRAPVTLISRRSRRSVKPLESSSN